MLCHHELIEMPENIWLCLRPKKARQIGIEGFLKRSVDRRRNILVLNLS
jgi:hypothetical protein